MVLTLMQAEADDVGGVSRLGGSGVGGGTAAGRHRAIQVSAAERGTRRAGLECVGCSRSVTGVAVVLHGRVFCTWDCAVSVAGTVPGQYFG